jgi:hypothetical protein
MAVGQTKMALPIQIKLKDPVQLTHQKQYLLKPEEKQGILSIINSLKQYRLLVECSSPYNTPILAVQKGPDKNFFKISSSFPSTQLFPIPILYWLKYPQKPNITLY